MGGVIRADLSTDLADGVNQLGEVVVASGADAVVAVIVDADGALCPMCNDEHRQLCEALKSALADRDLEVSASYVVDRVHSDERGLS